MSKPIVIAHHLIWTAYGWWLPNDPRGSGSRGVASDVIAQLGEVHLGRRRVQPAGREVQAFYEKAADVLKHPLLTFNSAAREVIGDAFGQVIDEEAYTCYACAVMPDHVHILIRKHKHLAEDMIARLQNASRMRLSATGHRPPQHPVWTGGGGWKVFLYHPDDVERTIRYIEKNPACAGLSPQRWPFVTAYDRWPLHPGHSPTSPYVRGLRAVGRYP